MTSNNYGVNFEHSLSYMVVVILSMSLSESISFLIFSCRLFFMQNQKDKIPTKVMCIELVANRFLRKVITLPLSSSQKMSQLEY